MLLWIVGTICVLALLAFVSVQANKRTCMRAYNQGVNDAGTLSWQEIVQRYRAFLKPIRPMDAAAYQRGIEYALNHSATSGNAWRSGDLDFLEAFRNGDITREGTAIRSQGAVAAATAFRLRVGQDLEDLIHKEPDQPLLAIKVGLDFEKCCVPASTHQ